MKNSPLVFNPVKGFKLETKKLDKAYWVIAGKGLMILIINNNNKRRFIFKSNYSTERSNRISYTHNLGQNFEFLLRNIFFKIVKFVKIAFLVLLVCCANESVLFCSVIVL